MQGLRIIIGEICSFLEARANPDLGDKYRRFFREGYDPYGITTADLEAYKKQLLEQYQDWTCSDFFDLGDQLFATGKYEAGGLAILLVASFKKQFTKDTLGRIGSWLDNGVQNWAHNDVICSELITPLWKRKVIALEDLASWRQGNSKWQRRSAAVGIIPLIKEAESADPYLDFIQPLMLDPVREVQQGVGWMLRETWKRYPQATEALLLEYKDSAPRLIYQYATEKMAKEEKARFKANKK